MNFGSKHVQQPQKQLRRVCARVSGLVGTRRGGTLVMTENLCVRLSGGVHIGVPSALRWERAVARACNEAHHKPIFGVFAVLSVFGFLSALRSFGPWERVGMLHAARGRILHFFGD